jgi:hypothetical protein
MNSKKWKEEAETMTTYYEANNIDTHQLLKDVVNDPNVDKLLVAHLYICYMKLEKIHRVRQKSVRCECGKPVNLKHHRNTLDHIQRVARLKRKAIRELAEREVQAEFSAIQNVNNN